MSKVNPYDSRFSEYSQEKLIKKREKIAEKYVSSNCKISIHDMIEWLSSINTDNYTNVFVDARTEPSDENGFEANYIVVRGDRLETDQEFKKRQESIISSWQSKYETFLQNKNYYENTELGQAQVAEVIKKSGRRVRYPEGMPKIKGEE